MDLRHLVLSTQVSLTHNLVINNKTHSTTLSLARYDYMYTLKISNSGLQVQEPRAILFWAGVPVNLCAIRVSMRKHTFAN